MKKGRFLKCLGLLLIAAALCITAYNILADRRAGKAVDATLQELRPMPAKPVPAPSVVPAAEELPASETEYPDYVLDERIEMPVTVINGQNYIGVLDIPDLELSLPVMEEWSYDRLNIAPCRYEGSLYTDDLIICAHNYNKHFGRLKTLAIGAELSFTDVDGNRFDYCVTEITTLGPRQVEEMESDDWDMTLFTCTVGGATRVTVRCDLVPD